jgi:sacsin
MISALTKMHWYTLSPLKYFPILLTPPSSSISELPCVLSGKYLGKINPNKEDESLIYRHSKLLQTHPNELTPYLGKFGFSESTCNHGFYKGTIFRFPLRRVGCSYNVSETVYTHEKITNIFETLRTQASMNLLFLKSLESIEVFTREPHGEIQQKLCVSVSNRTDKRLQERTKFFQGFGEELLKKECHVAYKIDIKTASGNSSVEDTSLKFLVCHYYNSIRVTSTFEKLLSNKDLSNNPIVSVAMPIREHMSEDCAPINDGHLFCFLPLPVDGKASPTGLPIHVNSFFAVDSKRSKIEWPTDQDGKEDLKNLRPELVWNQCLVTELLPEAYALLLHNATQETSLKGSDIYHYFPNCDEVNDKWQETLLPPFFRKALRMPLFPTVGGCEKYVALDNAVICPPGLDGELRSVLVKLLVSDEKNVVCPPKHVMEPIKEYCHQVEVTPSYVRTLLKENER